jgi:hypothetical protein
VNQMNVLAAPSATVLTELEDVIAAASMGGGTLGEVREVVYEWALRHRTHPCRTEPTEHGICVHYTMCNQNHHHVVLCEATALARYRAEHADCRW